MADKKFKSAPGPSELQSAGLNTNALTGTAAEIAAAKKRRAEEQARAEETATKERTIKENAKKLEDAQKKVRDSRTALNKAKERRRFLVDSLASFDDRMWQDKGEKARQTGIYTRELEATDAEMKRLDTELQKAIDSVQSIQSGGYKGNGTSASPFTKDGKPFTGDYRGTKYKDGVKVTESAAKDKIEGSGTADSPLKVNGKVVNGTYQGRKYVNGVVSTQVKDTSKDTTKDTSKDTSKDNKAKEDKGALTDTEVISKAESKYGELDSIFEQDSQLKELLRTAVEKKYTTNRFVQELERTTWFKSNAGPVRQRQFYKNQYDELTNELKTTDPDYQKKLAELNQTSEYGRGLQAVLDGLKEEETRQGKAMDDTTRLAQAKAIYDLANEGNPLAYRNSVTSFGKFGTTAVGGEAANALQGLRRVARANGFDLDAKYAGQKDSWINSILQGENPERFYALIRNDAAANQGAYVKELMQNGYNLDDVYGNYITLMAQSFNIDPNTIDIQDPLLQKVFTDKGGLKFNEFESLLRNDPRYKGTPGAFAEKDFRQSITDIALAEGAQLTEEQIDDVVNSALTLGAAANSSTVRSLIRAKIKYTPGSSVTGRAGNVLAELKATAAANGLNLDTAFGSSVQGWLQNVSQGESIETYKRIIRQTAKLGLPERVGSLLDQGVDLDTIYSPYKNIMASILEVNPETITLNDPTLRSAINQEGEMSLYDYQRSLRKDPRWQYTNNAREDVSNSVLQVLRDFGFQG